MQLFICVACHKNAGTPKTICMVRYVMSFSVPQQLVGTVQQVINHYFDDLSKHGPGGMRSQCYADYNDQCRFFHIKSFRRESVANQHFKSGSFRKYIHELAEICGDIPVFSKLEQRKTFESIY